MARIGALLVFLSLRERDLVLLSLRERDNVTRSVTST
jgi:hypothetical protein